MPPASLVLSPEIINNRYFVSCENILEKFAHIFLMLDFWNTIIYALPSKDTSKVASSVSLKQIRDRFFCDSDRWSDSGFLFNRSRRRMALDSPSSIAESLGVGDLGDRLPTEESRRSSPR